ncbi:unnamed protein product [Plutella xylostella]|uniref:(diamondback moth) hypothetical protein n=1 Tax=Plutella xylostella TaxID=51655 RepID=A0A8S4D5X1_PLUXY|nr:unnamed protein product [Plutella xylostella]
MHSVGPPALPRPPREPPARPAPAAGIRHRWNSNTKTDHIIMLLRKKTYCRRRVRSRSGARSEPFGKLRARSCAYEARDRRARYKIFPSAAQNRFLFVELCLMGMTNEVDCHRLAAAAAAAAAAAGRWLSSTSR